MLVEFLEEVWDLPCRSEWVEVETAVKVRAAEEKKNSEEKSCILVANRILQRLVSLRI